MAIRRVLKMGDPVLRCQSAPIENFSDPNLNHMITDMVDTMRHAKGVGLAAPQIGFLKRVVILEVNHNPRYPEVDPIPLAIIINPVIISHSTQTSSYWEGCLSVPGLRGKVSRYDSIVLRACDVNGNSYDTELVGFEARILQHEMDHLDGVLFPDRLESPEYLVYEDTIDWQT